MSNHSLQHNIQSVIFSFPKAITIFNFFLYSKWIRFIFKSWRWHFPRWFHCIMLLLHVGHEHWDYGYGTWCSVSPRPFVLTIENQKKMYDFYHYLWCAFGVWLYSKLNFIYTQFSMSWRKIGNFRFTGWKMRQMKNVMNWKFWSNLNNKWKITVEKGANVIFVHLQMMLIF